MAHNSIKPVQLARLVCTYSVEWLLPQPVCVWVRILHMGRTQAKHTVMDEDELRPADGSILDVLQNGRATKGMLVDETGYSRNTVYNRLEVLNAAGHVTVVHEPTRLFELVEDPRR
jgi:uncharacterized membrane protein